MLWPIPRGRWRDYLPFPAGEGLTVFREGKMLSITWHSL